MNYSDPYNNGNTEYQRHNYQDSADYFNPYQTEQYQYQQPPIPVQQFPPPQQQGYGLGRSNTVTTSASRYTSDFAPANTPFPPNQAVHPNLPPLPMNDSGRTLPGIPDEPEAEEPPMASRVEGPNLLRKPTQRASYINANQDPNPNLMDRSILRQSLTPLTRVPEKSAADIKKWRHDHHGGLWMRGSRGRCIGRFCCCTIMVTLLLIVSIVLALVMWVRPPDIQFTGVQTAANGSTFEQTTSNEFQINLGFGINVTNPNYFSATFTTIKAEIFYPINNTNVGGGQENDITFHAHSNHDFVFPFSFIYSKAADPTGAIIQDIATKCGIVSASTKQDISVQYTITLHLKVLVASVGPSFSGTANFACPVDASDLAPFLGQISGGSI